MFSSFFSVCLDDNLTITNKHTPHQKLYRYNIVRKSFLLRLNALLTDESEVRTNTCYRFFGYSQTNFTTKLL